MAPNTIQRTIQTSDGRTLTGEFAEYLAWTGREGLAPGSQGWWDDGMAHASHLTLETNRIGEVHAWLAERI